MRDLHRHVQVDRGGDAQFRPGLDAEDAAHRKAQVEVGEVAVGVDADAGIEVQPEQDLVLAVHHQPQRRRHAESELGGVGALLAVEQFEPHGDVAAVGEAVQVVEAHPGPAQAEIDGVVIGTDRLAGGQRPVPGRARRRCRRRLCSSS